MKNPFELVYAALFDIAARDPRVSSIVAPRNLIRYDQLRDTSPDKDNYTPSDLPELKLLSMGAGFNLHSTSSTCEVIRRYQWLIDTGNLSLLGGIYTVEWALFCAMVQWREVLGDLRWPQGATQSFVKRLSSGDANELQAGTPGKNLQGWACLWSCEILMVLPTADLSLYNRG